MTPAFRVIASLLLCVFVSSVGLAQDTRNSRPFHDGITDPASLKRVVDEHLARANALLTQLLDVKGTRTVENTLQPYDDMQSHIANAFGIANNTQSLHPRADIRDAAETARATIQELQATVNLRRDIFDALRGIELATVQNAATRYYVEQELAAFRLRGVELPDDTRAKLRTLRVQLTNTQAEFNRNIRNGNREIKTNLVELEGVPRDFLQRYNADANGVIVVPTNSIDVRTIGEFAQSRNLRKRAFIEWRNVAHPENAAVLQRLLETRYEIARLLSYPHWAELDMAPRMTRNSATVSSFIDQIAAASEQRARTEYQALLERKRKDDPSATSVEDWEQWFYQSLIRRERYDLDQQLVRQYFPSQRVVAGVIDLLTHLYGIEFKRVNNVPVWHPSVQVYELVENGTFLGRCYLDLYPREGKPGTGASHRGVRVGSARQTPESVVTAALPGGVEGDPGLMSHNDVRTLFHEFGHLVQFMSASRSRWRGLNGLPAEADAAEVTSTLAEEWIADTRTLQTFAKHYQTGEPITADLVQRIRKANEFGLGLSARYQLALTKAALEFHLQAPEKVDHDAIMADVEAKYVPLQSTPGTHWQSSWPHLANPLYTSAYYTYEWSRVIAKDLFTKFDRSDLLAPAASRRLRDLVMTPGKTKPAAQLFEDFLGRPFSAEAWGRWLNEGGRN